MSIKKSFTEVVLLFYKVVKALFITIPLLLVAVFIFSEGPENALDILLNNIIYAVVGIVLYSIVLSFIDRRIYIIRNSLDSMGNSSYTFEANIVSTLGNQAAGSNAQDFFPVAFPTEEVNIRVYRDAEESLADYKTFDFDYTSKTNPLLEKELFLQLEKVLQAHRLTRATKDPQAIISMDFFIGKKEQYTPPTTVTSTETKYVWTTGMIGWNVGGFTSAVPVISSQTTPGYTTVSYYSNIRLNFLNHAKLVKGEKLEIPPLIWVGEADQEGLNPDIRGIAPVIFDELMGQFSDRSANSSKCYARRVRYGGLGLGFNPSDWRLIRYVEPFSPAAEQGIKPGDVLMKINGKIASNWPIVSYGRSGNSSLYRSKDPYFQHVLSNQGDSDVELVIRSKTGKFFRKSVTLKMKPRNEDRYLSWKPKTR